MGGVTNLTTRGFSTVADIGKDNGNATQVGGRADLKRTINDFELTLSLTDATLRDYENAPYWKDALFTAERRVNDNVTVGAGFDLGARSAIVTAGVDTTVQDVDVNAQAHWFQAGNTLRGQATLKFDANNKLWGTYAFNGGNANDTRTYVNLVERNTFVIAPFTSDISNAAAKYVFTKDDTTVEPAYDFDKQAAYLSVKHRVRDDTYVRGAYAFNDEVALLEVGYHKPTSTKQPLFKFFAKAPAGPNGFGPLSLGFVLDKNFDITNDY